MREDNLKKRLINWLKGSSPEDIHLIDDILKYEGNDEVVLGAKMFLENNETDLRKMRTTISAIKTNKRISLIKFPIKSYALAASVIIIFSISLLFLYNSGDKKSELIIYEEGMPVFMGQGNQQSINEFMNLYRLGEYEKAKLLGASLTKVNISDTINYFMGCCCIYTEEYENALKYLNQINKPPAKFELGLKYQKAFAYSMSGNKDAAKIILEQLKKNPDQIHKEKINKFLKEIN